MKQLSEQEESFNQKMKTIQIQILSLNKLRYNFEKQRQILCEEKNRVVNNMSTLIDSWSPLFIDLEKPSDENSQIVTNNQKVISNLLSHLNQSEGEEEL